MKIIALLAALMASAAFGSTQTLVIPVQVTVTSTGTTVAIPAQSTTIPLATTTPPPTCGASPAASSATVACPTGTTGSWKQATSYTAAAYPTCWTPVVSPTSAPAGACTPVVTPPPPTANCGMQLGGTATFCDTFDAPAGTGTRAGDLNGNVWGVSRTIGDGVNFGQHWYNQWNATQIQKCDGSTPTVNAPADVIICNGQIREAVNDNNSGVFDAGTVTNLAMYPKQPFDFAGRTGTVSFDVSNDAALHGAWPEFWMSDLPVPGPFNHFDSWQALPANGFGVRFDSAAPVGQQGECPNANNLNKLRWTVDSVAVVRNFVLDDTQGYGPGIVKVQLLDCVISASAVAGTMNHVEVRVSQNAIDVYATDAGVAATPTTLRHIATVSNANLTLSRGLIWLEDAHYNGDKLQDPARPSMKMHTFAWDNVAFDGPFPGRDFTFDALDANTPGTNGAKNLGQFSSANQASTWTMTGLPANPQAAAARVLFDFNGDGTNPKTLNVTVNGHAHAVPWPYPENNNYAWRTYAVTIPLTDLVAGTNTVLLGTDVAMVFSNVDLVLAGVTGAVPVLPGSKNTYPGT